MRQFRSEARRQKRTAVCLGTTGLWCGIIVAVLFGGACGDDTERYVDPLSYSCPPPAPTECPEPAPRYADVAPLIKRNCLSCHYGYTDGPWPLTDYQHVADWADVVRDEVRTCLMPPPDAGFQMLTADRVALLTWIRCGFPE